MVTSGSRQNYRAELMQMRELAIIKRKDIVTRLQNLVRKVQERELTHADYLTETSRKINGRTLSEWVEYYESYIEECDIRIKIEQSKVRKSKIVSHAFTLIISVAIIAALFLTGPALTGFVVKEFSEFVNKGFTEKINLVFKESTTYEWTPENKGTISSLSISGSLKGNGTVRIYLEDLLIFDNSQISEKEKTSRSFITGNVIDEGFAASEEKNEESPAAEEKTEDNQEESSPESNPEIAPSVTPAIEEESNPSPEPSSENQTEENSQDNNSGSDKSETIPPIETIPETPINETIPLPEEIARAFKEICIETCDLAELALLQDSYKIRIEIENAELSLESLHYTILQEIPEIIVTDVNVSLVQGEAKLGQPVAWTEEINLDNAAELHIELPNGAFNISLESENESSLAQLPQIIIEKEGRVRENVQVEAQENINKITTRVSASQPRARVTYLTQAPLATEEESARTKTLRVTGDEEVHYENVQIFATLNESWKIQNTNKVQIYWVENNSYIAPNNFQDTNNNTYYDYVEWTAPHLSNQTFIIILITEAEHLDAERKFVSDIYEQVKTLDNNWSETIPNTHYVRVTFETNLTNQNDITIFPRFVLGTPKVEVYEKDSMKQIAIFDNITENSYNKIFLTNLESESQDTFDLRVTNGDIEFDHIIDPTYVLSSGSIDLALVALDNSTIALAWINFTSNSTQLKIMDTNGTNLTNTITVDQNVGHFSRVSLAPINTTAVFIAWVNQTNADDLRAIYLRNGSRIVGPSTSDGAIGTANRWDISLARLRDRIVYCYIDQAEGDVDVRYFNITTGALIGGEWDTDTGATPEISRSNVVDCSAFNESSYVVAWYDAGGTDDLTLSYNNTLGNLRRLHNVDAAVGTTAQVATTSLDNDRVAIAFYDNADQDITLIIKDNLNNTISGPTDIETAAGTTSSLAMATINNGSTDNFVVVWYNQSSIDIVARTYNGSGTPISPQFAIEREPQNFVGTSLSRNTTFPLIAATGKDGQSGASLCAGTFAVAYVNQSNSTLVKTFQINGTEWSGVCGESIPADTTPPVVTINRPQNATLTRPILFNVTLDETGSFCNYTLTNGALNYSMQNNGNTDFNATNATIADGSYNARYYCWDAVNNLNSTQNVTFSVDFSTLPQISFVSPTPANNSLQSSTSIFINVSSSDASDHYTLVDFNRDLLLWMRMENINESGDPIDSSTYSKNGSRVGGAVQNASGYINSSFSFDGINDRVELGDVPEWRFTNESNFTISAWVYRKTNGTAVQSVFDKFAGQGYRLFYQSTGLAQFQIRNGSGTIFSVGGTAASYVPNEAWVHMAATFTGNKIELYINGTSVASDTPTIALANGTTGAYIGYSPGNNMYFNGSIDEVVLFARALNVTEVRSLYNASAYKYERNFTVSTTQYNFTAHAVDFGANTNSTSITFSTDSLNPDLDYVAPTETNGTHLSRNYILVNATATDANLQSIVHRLYNSSFTQINTSNSSISQLYTNFSSLGDGRYYFNSSANDSVGNVNHTQTRTIVLDTIVPIVQFQGATPVDESIRNNPTITIELGATDTNLANLTLRIHNSSGLIQADFLTESPISIEGDFPDGTYFINGSASDLANNLAYSETRTFIIDTVAPNFTVISPTNITYGTSNITINFTSSDTNGINTRWYNNESANVSYTGVTSIILSQGSHTLTFYSNDSAGNLNSTSVTFSIIASNTAPQILAVSTLPSQNPIENTFTNIQFNFTAYDANGATDLDTIGSANFTRSGQNTRYNSTCTQVNTFDTNYANYSCTMQMWYFDAAGTWNITAAVDDTESLLAQNTTTTFTYNELSAFVSYPSALTWSSLTPGLKNQSSDNDPLILNNTGNRNITTVQINATNLRGETDNSKAIWAGNLTFSLITGSSTECNINTNQTTTLIASSFVNISNSTLPFGNRSITNAGTSNLYACIREIGSELSQQAYSTSSEGSWTIRILVVGVLFGTRSKKRKFKKDNLVKAISLITEELREKYSLTKSETIGLLVDELKENYDLESKELQQLSATPSNVPLAIFSTELGFLEALCKYLHENREMKYSEIARVLNRDERTVWTAYHKSIAKYNLPFKTSKSSPSVPLSIFASEDRTIAESLIMYLNENGSSYSEIARVLNRDQRNIWTINSRARHKKSLRQNNEPKTL